MVELEKDYVDFVGDEFADGESADGQWRIDSDDAANWALRRIAQAEQSIRKREEFVHREIDRLIHWKEKADEADRRVIEYFSAHLRTYFEQLRESGLNRNSYRLPAGTIGTRKTPAKFIRDTERLVEWAEKTDPSLVRVKKEPDWAAVRKRLVVNNNTVVDSVTGEVVPGVVVAEPSRDEFFVKTEVE